MKLLAIGLDGFSFRVVSPWLEDGSLPHLKSLMEGGSHGSLMSTVPPLTPPAWYSSLTGLNPGRHNIFGFFKAIRERYAKIPVSIFDLGAPALWDHLGRAGLDSIVLYLPVSYPPPEIKGIMVSGFMTPEEAGDYARPRKTAEEIADAVPGFRLNLDHRNIRLGRLEDFYRDALEVLDKQVQAALFLMENKPWNFFFIHLHDLDSITHIFWKYQDPEHPGYSRDHPHADLLKSYYRQVDESVGRLCRAAGGETAVMVYSDHGFMPAYRFFNVNRWLMDRGMMKVRGEGTLGLKSSLARLGLGRERLGWWASRLGLSSLSRKIPGRVKGAFPRTRFSFDSLAGHVDWPGTTAYFLSSSEGSLYANIRGREPWGSLTQTQAETLLGEIKEALLEEVDAGTGRNMLEAVFGRDEIYHGKYAQSSPDLLLLPAEGYYFSESGLGPLVGDQGVVKHQISATHHPEGAVIVSGGPFARGAAKLTGPRIWDVTPTLLYALGVDIPGDLDGRVLEEFIDGRHLSENPVSYGESLESLGAEGKRGLEEGEIKEIISNLESLGYY